MDKANRAERLTDALKLLEETAKEKKEELTTLLSDKYSNLKETLSDSTHNVAEKLGAMMAVCRGWTGESLTCSLTGTRAEPMVAWAD